MSEASQALLDSIAKNPRSEPRLPPVYARDLSDGDIPALELGKPPSERREPVIAELQARHHMLAMLLAAGASDARASFVTGWSTTTVSRIRLNPQFKELQAYYTSQKEAEFQDFHQKAALVGLRALEELDRRLELVPDSLATKDIIAIMEKLFDRTILPSKAAAQPQAPAQSVQPITVIQFVDSPDSSRAPPTIDISARPQARLANG